MKATPAFDRELCGRIGIPPLEFDGLSDSLFQACDPEGRQRMEYLNHRGTFADVPFATVEADDATVFPAPRVPFLRAWISARGHIGRALVRDGSLAAWGVIRPCRSGRRIGPLVADDRAAAEAVFAALLAADGAGEVFLDVPSVNSEAVALAHDHGLTPVFETARMYTGAIRPVRLERVFGVTTFELG